MANLYTKLTPRLVVDDARAALAFYAAVFDAVPVPGMLIEDGNGHVIHAEMDIGGMRMSLTEADGTHNRSPTDLGGSASLLVWYCDDPDAVQDRVEAAGGSVLIPVDDRYYGMRDGRLADPSGHLWLVTRQVKALDAKELKQRSRAT